MGNIFDWLFEDVELMSVSRTRYINQPFTEISEVQSSNDLIVIDSKEKRMN